MGVYILEDQESKLLKEELRNEFKEAYHRQDLKIEKLFVLVDSIQKDNTEIVKITKELKVICQKQEINIEKLAIAVDSLGNNDKEFMEFMKNQQSKGNGYVEKVAFILIGAIPSCLMKWFKK